MRSSEATRRNARAALIWHHRVNLGRTLDIPWVGPTQRPVASAFSIADSRTNDAEGEKRRADELRRCVPSETCFVHYLGGASRHQLFQ